jgi:hypothetical protein
MLIKTRLESFSSARLWIVAALRQARPDGNPPPKKLASIVRPY